MESNGVRLLQRAFLGGLTLLLVLFMFSAPGYAQSTATLKGTVTDASGATIPNATILVRNQDTGIEWPTKSDSAGNYQVSGLPNGVYRLEVSAQNFKKRVFTDLVLDVASTVVQDVRLEIGAVTQEDVVTAEAPLIQTSTMSVGQVIDQKTTQEIPLNGRHFVDLALLIPGTVTPPQNGFLTAPLRGQGSFAFNTAGQREDTVNFMINGINLNDEVQNQITFQPSINTVAEFKVDNSTYSAEYGRNSGAIVNIATRSGANQYHGELFEFYRNNALDARNFFNPKTATLPSGAVVPNKQSFFNRNNFGANLGGPILHDKAFFFASYEGLRQRQGITIVTQVPTDAQRAAVTDATVLKLLPMIPHVNGTDANGVPAFLGSASAPVNIDQGTGDLQFNLTQNDTLHGYLAIQQDLRQEPTLQGNSLPGWGDTRASRRQIMTINENHVFGPNMTNEVRFGYNRIHIVFTPNQLLNPASFGITNGINAAIGLPQIIVGAIGLSEALDIGGPSGFPQGRGDTTVALNDTFHWLRGRHAFALGGEVRRFYNNNLALNIGSFTFPDLAHFLNDQASRFNVTVGSGNDKILEPAWGIFAQDNFKWRPNFTLELGLRYDWNSTPSAAANRFTVFSPATGSLIQVGTNGIGQVFQTNNMNVQPRVGFAWDPFGDGKTAVRAGYAILTDQPVANAVSPLSGNPPFALPVTLTSSTNALTFTNVNPNNPTSVSPSAINSSFKNPYVQSWNLNIQRELPATMALTVGYFGSKGTHLRILRNLNQRGSAATAPFPTLSATSPVQPPCVPAPCVLGNISEVDSGSNSNYNALWVTLNKRISHGLQFNTSYTYSKSLDYNSLSSVGNPTTQDSFNIRNDYGPSDFDVRHRWVLNAIYNLPFKGNRLYEGWQLGVITQAQSGNPLTIITSNTSFTGNQTVHPDVTGPVGITGNPAQWFVNKAVFVFPGTGTTVTHFGNLGRNAVTGPDFVNTDFSIIKDTKITERTNFEFRVEAFDIFNHPNFGNPGRVLGSTLGVISSTRFPTGDFGSARQLQIAAKFQF